MLSRLGELETALNSSHEQVANERQSRLTLSLVNPSPMFCRTYDPKSRGGEISDHAPCEWLAAWESLVYGAYGAIPRSLSYLRVRARTYRNRFGRPKPEVWCKH